MIVPNFQIKERKETADFAQFIIEPLQPGYGQTLGNTLRRILLTSLPGAAISQVKIAGVRHKFSTLKGLKEDIIELILNLKQVRLAYQGEKPVKLELVKNGPGEVKAGDIKAPAVVKIINKDLVLANLADKEARLKMEMVVETGFGYQPAEEKKTEKIGIILMDTLFSPVRRVNYWVEATRVGRETNWDRLILEITTDGTIKPKEALKKAAQISVDFFNRVVKPQKMAAKSLKSGALGKEIVNLTVEELELPTRIVNALRKGGYGMVSNLDGVTTKDLARVKNLGEKSIEIVQKALLKKGVNLKKEEK